MLAVRVNQFSARQAHAETGASRLAVTALLPMETQLS